MTSNNLYLEHIKGLHDLKAYGIVAEASLSAVRFDMSCFPYAAPLFQDDSVAVYTLTDFAWGQYLCPMMEEIYSPYTVF